MKAITKKLYEFQKLGLTIGKDAVNPHFKSKYASLSHILELVVPKLNEIGLTLTSGVEGGELVTKVVDHDSGEFVQSSFPLYGQKAQEIGSSVTYARRYSIVSLLSLNVDEDDDGNQANEAVEITKEWFNAPQLTAFLKVKDKYATGDEAIKAIRQKYALNKAMEQEVRNLY